MKNIILASNNEHKIKEFKEILTGFNVLSLKDINFNEEIEETGTTFAENALIKAKAISNYLKGKELSINVLAEDSGLCCNGLDNKPGIYSARYAGDHDDQANRDKLRKELKDKEDKTAYFIATIILYHPDGTYKLFEGRTDGVIIDEERGSKEFGYDPIFYSTDLNKTFGEATKEEKNSVSHRRKAIDKLLLELK